MLENRIADVKALDPNTIRHSNELVHAAARRVRGTILEIFGENSREYSDHKLHDIAHYAAPVSTFSPLIEDRWSGLRIDPQAEKDAMHQRAFVAGIPRTVTMLESLIKTVRERTDPARPASATGESGPGASDRVFVVHGRQEAPRETVARFVERLGLKAIILHEQASESRTIIEKFERHADVGYAVVLLTADDQGGLIGDDASNNKHRARQNVILELGYFVGKLGRGRVCVLYEQDVEIPSDFHGVGYVRLDADGAWRLSLAREMKVAGLDVDLNRAL